jgi:large subunit ribosomal protein L24
MKSKFSKSWNSSKSPRKQRKYLFNAPLHIRRKLIASKLSKELSKKYSRRSVIVRKGDTVKIMRGNFKNHSGKIQNVLTKKFKVEIEGIEKAKRDGNKSYYPIHPSNLMITQLVLEDKKRQKMLERKIDVTKENKNE